MAPGSGKHCGGSSRERSKAASNQRGCSCSRKKGHLTRLKVLIPEPHTQFGREEIRPFQCCKMRDRAVFGLFCILHENVEKKFDVRYTLELVIRKL